MNDLDARLIAAHAKQDSVTLSALYTDAANRSDDTDAQCFFLTQAYVFALEAGLPDSASLKARLISAGREAPAES
ncbi:MAG: hypothetical protein ABJ251_21875 [Paracoccaceae bacterium]